MSRVDMWAVSVAVDGVNLGIFDKMQGGDPTAEGSKYPPGGMGDEIPLGGRVSVSDITVERLYEHERDHTAAKGLMGKVGKGIVVVTKQPLDEDKNVFGDPIVYQGKLKTYTNPEPDSESSDPALFGLEVESASIIS